ncbi:hypothetical protein AKJ16_DCAP00723 [Drosera capensis]
MASPLDINALSSSSFLVASIDLYEQYCCDRSFPAYRSTSIGIDSDQPTIDPFRENAMDVRFIGKQSLCNMILWIDFVDFVCVCVWDRCRGVAVVCFCFGSDLERSMKVEEEMEIDRRDPLNLSLEILDMCLRWDDDSIIAIFLFTSFWVLFVWSSIAVYVSASERDIEDLFSDFAAIFVHFILEGFCLTDFWTLILVQWGCLDDEENFFEPFGEEFDNFATIMKQSHPFHTLRLIGLYGLLIAFTYVSHLLAEIELVMR